MNDSNNDDDLTPEEHITNKIAELPDWRGQRLARLREIIHAAAPGITEEWKWGTAVWSQKGNVVAAAAFKDYIKLNFFKGAALPDPHGIFNAGLDAKVSRAIDIGPADEFPENALDELIRAAVALNTSGGKKK
jgi:hypothetical protein